MDMYQTGDISDNDTIKYYEQADARRFYASSNTETNPSKQRARKNTPALPEEVLEKCFMIWWPRDFSIAKVSEKVAREASKRPDAASAPDEIDLYLSVTRALASNISRATYIHLLQIILEILPRVPYAEGIPGFGSVADVKNMTAKWKSTVKQLTIDICRDIPYALGEVDEHGTQLPIPLAGSSFRAYLQLFPLLTGLGATRKSPECQTLVKGRLTYIGDVLGIGMAKQMAAMAHITADIEMQRTPTPEYDFSSSVSSIDSPPRLSMTPSLDHMRPVRIAIR
jgi:hypothetical protein